MLRKNENCTTLQSVEEQNKMWPNETQPNDQGCLNISNILDKLQKPHVKYDVSNNCTLKVSIIKIKPSNFSI